MMSSASAEAKRDKVDLSAKYETLYRNYKKSYIGEKEMTPKMAAMIAHWNALTQVVFNTNYIRQAIKEEEAGDARNMKWLLKNAPNLKDRYSYSEIIDIFKRREMEFRVVEIRNKGDDLRSSDEKLMDGLIKHTNIDIMLELRSMAKKKKDAKAYEYLDKRYIDLYLKGSRGGS